MNGESVNDLAGAGLQVSGSALTLNATGDWTGTIDGVNFGNGTLAENAIWVGGAAAIPSELTLGAGGTILGVSGGTLAYISTTTIPLGGDVTGTLSATVVGDNSHAHDATTISGLGTGDFTSANVSQWTNDANYATNPFVHPAVGFSATSTSLAVGTTTTVALLSSLTVSSSTAPQLALSAGAGIAQWVQRNAGGNLYFSTTTIAGTATTSISALEIAGDGFGTTTVRGLNISGQATTTSNVGINLSGGCFAINNECVGGGTGTFTNNLVSGGTATTTFYNGGIIFASSTGSGLLSQSSQAKNFFWDEENKRFGLGTSTPTSILSIQAGATIQNLFGIASSTGAPILTMDWYGAITQNVYSSKALDIQNGSGVSVFSIDTTQPTNAGIDITAANGQTGNLLNFFASDGTTVLSTFDSIGRLGVGTSTSQYLLTIASSTVPQLSLSAGAGIAQWTFRNAGGNFYLSTTTLAGTATTSISALEIAGGGFGTTTVRGLNIDAQATTTSDVGFNITTGCYAINGTCINNQDNQFVSANSTTTKTISNAATSTLYTLSIIPKSANADIYVSGFINIAQPQGTTDFTTQVNIMKGGDCTLGGSNVLAFGIASTTSTTGINGASYSINGLDNNTTVTTKTYALCARNSTYVTPASWSFSLLVINQGADLAELYTTTDNSLQPGDIISADKDNFEGVRKTTGRNDVGVLGVVSTNPASVIGPPVRSGKVVPIALSGRVPVKVNIEGGPISVGDRIALSSVPGVGKKASQFEDFVGIALENYTEDSTSGMVLIFIDIQKGIDIEQVNNALLAKLSITLATSTSPGMALNLTSEGRFIINQTATTTSGEATTTPAVIFDSLGNAFFAGQITANGFNLGGLSDFENSVSGLTSSLAEISSSTASTTLTLESLQNSLNELASTTTGIASTTDKLALDFASTSVYINDLASFASTTDLNASSTHTAFLDGFFTNLFAKINTWLADATNGISSIIAGTFRAKEKICVDDQCLTKEDVRKLLNLANGLTGSEITPPTPLILSGESGTSTPPIIEEPTASTTPEIIPEITPPVVETPPAESPAPAPAPEPTPTPEPTVEPAPQPSQDASAGEAVTSEPIVTPPTP
ncbi:MAG: hypothetical protein V1896_02730 [Candidatus Zambryskibacteria bacterium]